MNTPLAGKPWLSVKETAELFGYSVSTIKHWLKTGRLGPQTGAHHPGRGMQWRINRVEFEEKFLNGKA
ncbi:MAG TPA: helix-turn-helix domain-containing protein [Candidatus Binatus sp.]|uniref:helix-turn-helix domain-containing protein n=1 Tax=Candidatus Binatus sp. TaxID=2811406 RepID=UPI002B47353F|nr:helix-turn-helix domain-containing protein [Candidatus Binatus sp.]HKN12812.1 helix-turn-helix domain-containing protein [Candidatus Binatus sp.]